MKGYNHACLYIGYLFVVCGFFLGSLVEQAFGEECLDPVFAFADGPIQYEYELPVDDMPAPPDGIDLACDLLDGICKGLALVGGLAEGDLGSQGPIYPPSR